jgi:hypothetical protein
MALAQLAPATPHRRPPWREVATQLALYLRAVDDDAIDRDELVARLAWMARAYELLAAREREFIPDGHVAGDAVVHALHAALYLGHALGLQVALELLAERPHEEDGAESCDRG